MSARFGKARLSDRMHGNDTRPLLDRKIFRVATFSLISDVAQHLEKQPIFAVPSTACQSCCFYWISRILLSDVMEFTTIALCKTVSKRCCFSEDEEISSWRGWDKLVMLVACSLGMIASMVQSHWSSSSAKIKARLSHNWNLLNNFFFHAVPILQLCSQLFGRFHIILIERQW